MREEGERWRRTENERRQTRRMTGCRDRTASIAIAPPITTITPPSPLLYRLRLHSFLATVPHSLPPLPTAIVHHPTPPAATPPAARPRLY